MDRLVKIGEDSTRVVVEGNAEDALIVLAHGAGSDRDGRSILALRDQFLSRGLGVARFNFLYKEAGRGMPDRMPTLMETYRAVVELLRTEVRPGALICGGHSMGGRTASMIAAEGDRMDGLLLLAYPLHPAGQPHKLRDAHLPLISVPTLCINGTRDALCTPELMKEVLKHVQPGFEMKWIEDADHSYKAPKRAGDVMAKIGDCVADWANQRRSQR